MRYLAILSLFLIIACSEDNAEPCPVVDIENNGNTTEIDEEIIQEILYEFHSGFNWIHVVQSTNNVTSTDNFNVLPFNIEPQMEIDYMDRNVEENTISPNILSPGRLVTSQEVGCLFSAYGLSSGWMEYYNRYESSKGILSFSLPGFDSTGKLGILEYQHTCGDLCATGYIVILQKSKGNWKVLNRYISWVS